MSTTEIAKQTGALCVGATAVALGMTTGLALGAIALINIGVLWRDLKSGSTTRTHSAAIDAALQAFKAPGEYREDDLEAAANLLTHLPRETSFDASDVVHLIGEDRFASTMAARMVALLKPDPQTPAIGDILHKALEAGFKACANAKDFNTEMQAPVAQATLQTTYRLESRINDLVETIEGQLGDLRQEYDRTLVQMAKRIAYDVPDRDAALTELDRAVTIVQRMEAEGTRPSNHPDFVDEVFARVAALNRNNETEAAATALEDALRQETEETEARQARFLDGLIDQYTLNRDADAVADAVLRKLPLHTPDPTARFTALRVVRSTWYERGRDKGLNFDLEVSIILARASIQAAQIADQLGTTFNDLGIALATLGQRETGTGRLEDAVAAYRAALEVRTRDRVPLDWAATQMNLGIALAILGGRETGTERLKDAVTAYRAALKEFTRDRVPLKWAGTQMNLGSALATLGRRETGTARLDDAVTAYRAALKERTRDRVPLDWAMTQMNLANALATLGQRETGITRLEDAVTAYRAALKEFTRDRVPLDWANTIGNEGAALITFADRTNNRDLVLRARAQLTEAAQVLRDGGHIPWAITFENQLPYADAVIARLS